LDDAVVLAGLLGERSGSSFSVPLKEPPLEPPECELGDDPPPPPE
jgi:hypothetical protein